MGSGIDGEVLPASEWSLGQLYPIHAQEILLKLSSGFMTITWKLSMIL